MLGYNFSYDPCMEPPCEEPVPQCLNCNCAMKYNDHNYYECLECEYIIDLERDWYVDEEDENKFGYDY